MTILISSLRRSLIHCFHKNVETCPFLLLFSLLLVLITSSIAALHCKSTGGDVLSQMLTGCDKAVQQAQ